MIGWLALAGAAANTLAIVLIEIHERKRNRR